MTNTDDLRSAAIGWAGKAHAQMRSKDVAAITDDRDKRDEFRKIRDNMGAAYNFTEEGMLNLGSQPETAKQKFGFAKGALENVQHLDAWELIAEYYWDCIYEGGEGSGYETGWYRDAGVSDAIGALDELIALAEDEMDAS